MKYLISILVTAYVLTCVSCEKEVAFKDVEISRKVIANGLLSDGDSLVAIKLSFSRFFLDEGPFSSIEDARVQLFVNENSYQMYASKEGFYYANTRVEAGDVCAINIYVPSYEPISANTLLPSKPEISNTQLNIISNTEEDKGSISFTLHDPISETNYYRLRVFTLPSTGAEISYRSYVAFHTKDASITSPHTGPPMYESYETELLFSDTYINGKAYPIVLNGAFSRYDSEPIHEETSENQTYYILLESLSKDLYMYYTTIKAARRSEHDPFSEAVQIYSNITNGLGIWGGRSTVVKEAEFRD